MYTFLKMQLFKFNFEFSNMETANDEKNIGGTTASPPASDGPGKDTIEEQI